jgi:hypothetical protein
MRIFSPPEATNQLQGNVNDDTNGKISKEYQVSMCRRKNTAQDSISASGFMKKSPSDRPTAGQPSYSGNKTEAEIMENWNIFCTGCDE